MIDICEIFTHWHAGRSKNEIAGSLGLSRNTVRKYLAAAEAAGMAPGGPAGQPGTRGRELARDWFPGLADTRLRQVTWPAIAGHRDYIVEQLEAGVTMATIHQRLRDERGLAVSVASLRRYVAANLPEEARRSQVRCCGWCGPSPGRKRRSTTGSWAGGWTRGPGAGTWSMRSRWCCAARGTCSSARSWPWTSKPGPSATWRRSGSSAACPRGWCRTT